MCNYSHNRLHSQWTEKAHLTVVRSMLDSPREVLARLSTNDQWEFVRQSTARL